MNELTLAFYVVTGLIVIVTMLSLIIDFIANANVFEPKQFKSAEKITPEQELKRLIDERDKAHLAGGFMYCESDAAMKMTKRINELQEKMKS